MSTLLGSEELEEKVRHIQKKRQEAQLRVSTKNKTRSMSAVSNNEGPGKGTPRLGPAVYTKIKVNSTPTKALVDTGSPATIIALDYVLDLLAKER